MLLGVLAAASVATGPGATPDLIGPVWEKAPKPAAVKAAWPPAALAAHRDGKVGLECVINVRGRLEDCRVESEDPPGQGFGAAALSLAPSYLFTPARQGDRPTPYRLSLPVVFSQTDRPADWYKRPTSEQLHAVWPTRALSQGLGGRVVVDCRVNLHGVTEDCRVISETPAGQNFGTAALLLMPQFLFTPAIVGGQPTASRVTIPIAFQAMGRPGGALVGGSAIISRPVWAAAPTFADLGAAYPKAGGGSAGYVAFRCEVKKTGDLRACDLVREEPTGRGFEEAARKLIHLFRMQMTPELLAAHESLEVNLPIRVIDPSSAEFRERRMGEPVWLTRLDPGRVHKLYPAEAANRGIRTGRGVADCAVTAQGALADCSPSQATPDGVGFSEAAVEIARVMKMNPWTQEGGPVDGARLRFPMRFYLAEPASPPAAGNAATPPPKP